MPNCFLPPESDEPTVTVTGVTAARLDQVLGDLPETSANWARATGFAADAGEVCLLPDGEGGLSGVLFGLGVENRSAGLAAGKLPTVLPPGAYRLGEGFRDVQMASVAWALGDYRFSLYQSKERRPRTLQLSEAIDGDEVRNIVEGVYLARDLINTPANEMGPAELAQAANDLSTRHGGIYAEVVGDALLVERFPLVHAVGAAATKERAPRLIDFTWGDRDAPRITLVGKGVCFDTGGLDIKPASGMLLMKKDMGGAANVLGLASMIMKADLPVRLRVIIPAVENAIASAAFRPGDIFRSRQGLSVEIGHTDAEGRLVLADALTLACEDRPELLIDLATLTGAARVALGPEVMPFYTEDDAIAASLAAHASSVADPLWRMPLWPGYASMLKSDVADLNNVGGAFAGSITAALFLSKFVTGDGAWVHGDIFGWTPKAQPGKPAGGEAQAIRALFALIKGRHTA